MSRTSALVNRVSAVWLVTAAVLASGCAPAADENPQSGTERQDSSRMAENVSPPPEDSGTRLGEADLRIRRDAYLKRVASDYGLGDMPEIELVRWVSPSNWATVQAECLREAGFPVAVQDGGIVAEGEGIPEAQAGPFNEARYACAAKYTMHPQYQLPLSTTALGKLYDYYVEQAVPCLTREGVSVSEPPSREVWIARMRAAQAGGSTVDMWAPYRSVDPAEQERLAGICPQQPELELLIEFPPDLGS
jgi:hypothetical protein